MKAFHVQIATFIQLVSMIVVMKVAIDATIGVVRVMQIVLSVRLLHVKIGEGTKAYSIFNQAIFKRR